MTMHAQVTVGRVAVTVANVNTALIEYEGQPVCTTRQLAEFYGCAEKNLADNFQNNAGRFVEGKHFVKLEDVYFRAKGAAQPRRDQHPLADGLAQFRRARALDMATRTAERICAQFPSLGDPARQVIFAKIINRTAGSDDLELPALTNRTYCAA